MTTADQRQMRNAVRRLLTTHPDVEIDSIKGIADFRPF